MNPVAPIDSAIRDKEFEKEKHLPKKKIKLKKTRCYSFPDLTTFFIGLFGSWLLILGLVIVSGPYYFLYNGWFQPSFSDLLGMVIIFAPLGFIFMIIGFIVVKEGCGGWNLGNWRLYVMTFPLALIIVLYTWEKFIWILLILLFFSTFLLGELGLPICSISLFLVIFAIFRVLLKDR